MNEDATAGKTTVPITMEMLESLASDYKAGRLPDEVKARIESLRDEYFENFRDRFADLKGDLKPGIDELVIDLKSQVGEYQADGGTFNSEVMDSRFVPVVANAVDGMLDKVAEPVIDAVEDVVRDTFDYVSELVQIRAGHDPDGLYADKLAASQEEMDRAGVVFEADIEQMHGAIDTVHDRLEQLRVEVEEFHQDHAPVQVIMSTTVDPNLPEQMAEETSEGAA